MTNDEIINEYEYKAIARRLTIVRTHMAGDNKADFARLLGIMPSRWSNLERGWPLTMKVAWMLVKTVDGLSVSYLTHGTYGDVDPKLSKKLQLLEKELYPSDMLKNRQRIKEAKVKKLEHQLAEARSELWSPSTIKGGKGRPSHT